MDTGMQDSFWTVDTSAEKISGTWINAGMTL